MFSALQLHKLIQNKILLESRMVTINQLAKELEVELNQLNSAVEILITLEFLEVDSSEGVLFLTTSGKLANLE
jgi:hypothetical protein